MSHNSRNIILNTVWPSNFGKPEQWVKRAAGGVVRAVGDGEAVK